MPDPDEKEPKKGPKFPLPLISPMPEILKCGMDIEIAFPQEHIYTEHFYLDSTEYDEDVKERHGAEWGSGDHGFEEWAKQKVLPRAVDYLVNKLSLELLGNIYDCSEKCHEEIPKVQEDTGNICEKVIQFLDGAEVTYTTNLIKVYAKRWSIEIDITIKEKKGIKIICRCAKKE